ncbi:hypothetical protein [Arsenophonus apicola]|uniref:Uncharacterized protein n=1 Tax=Arsenophonus apicola TaxID=2879119 RepID=A0ABY8NZI4_9GAMM|nr:hypothetical protein [Arsenophonus apicola]WGO82166.1 hypothetical protein QG404_00110 [Arsenophonus apicola]
MRKLNQQKTIQKIPKIETPTARHSQVTEQRERTGEEAEDHRN